MTISGYEYVMCKSSQSVQWSGFSGQISFTFKTPARKWCRGRECFMAVKPRIVYNDGTNQIPMKKIDNCCTPYISKNPCSVLFSTGKCLVNDKLISNMNELSSTNTLFKTIFDTKAMQDTVESTCPILPQSIAEDRLTYASRNQVMFDKVNEHTLTWSLPFPLFQSNAAIPPHTKVQMDLNVNPNWIYEIINCVGKFPAGGIVPLVNGGNTVANSIGVGIDDITIWLYMVTEVAPVNMVKEIPLKQYFSQIHPINSTNDCFTLTLPNGGRNVTHILACFLQTKRGVAPVVGSVKGSSNDFSSGYAGDTGGATGESNTYESKITNDAVTNLKSLRFQTADRVFPNPDYLLDLSVPVTPVNNTIYDCGDLARSFTDFLNHSQSKFDRSGNILSIQQYIREPIFCYRTDSESTSYNETLLVNISLGTGYTAGTSQLLVVALYDETLRLHFDTEKIINVELIS